MKKVIGPGQRWHISTSTPCCRPQAQSPRLCQVPEKCKWRILLEALYIYNIQYVELRTSNTEMWGKLANVQCSSLLSQLFILHRIIRHRTIRCCRKYLQTGLSWNVGAFAIYSFANQWIHTISYWVYILKRWNVLELSTRLWRRLDIPT